MNQFLQSIRTFAADDEGAQIVEYALIIAVISLGLILMLMPATGGLNFTGFIARVNACLTGGTCA